MPDEIDLMLDFVEGRIDAAQFAAVFYRDEQFKTVLSRGPLPSRTPSVASNVYDFILFHNFSDPDDVVRIQGVLVHYLEQHGISPTTSPTYDELDDVLVTAQPGWADVDSQFLKDRILRYAGERTGDALKQWISNRLFEQFTYLTQPPQWIQNPAWPMNEHGPLVFLGQIEMLNYFHDEAAAYVFHDPVTGVTETIIQVA